jgi:hypothetical protein
MLIGCALLMEGNLAERRFQAAGRNRLWPAFAAAALIALAASPVAAKVEGLQNPMRFFEGRTLSVSTMKVVMKKPIRVRSVGRGVIEADGSLNLVQHVEEDGRRAHDRRWRIRRIAPGRFVGTMTDAKGPVTIEEVNGRYRFRFKLGGNLAVEQWVIPLPGGASALNKLTIKKLGITVARSEGTIRKLD